MREGSRVAGRQKITASSGQQGALSHAGAPCSVSFHSNMRGAAQAAAVQGAST